MRYSRSDLEEEIEEGRKYAQNMVERCQCFGGACCIQP